MKNLNVRLFIFAGIIFIFLYILLALKPLAKEYQFEPDWTLNISSPSVTPSASDKLIKFHLGQNAGYFTEGGKIAKLITFPSKITISDNSYCCYDTNCVNPVFYDALGSEKGVIQAQGFPMIEDDRIFVFLPGGTAFSVCNESGNVLWTFENTMPITAFASKGNYTSAGLADGSIILNNIKSGKKEMEYAPGGSDYPVILGLDISESGDYIASVSGQNQQRFILAKKEGNQPKIIYHEFLNTDSINRTFVYFCKDDGKVLYNYGNKLGIFDILDSKKTEIQLNSRIINAKETENLIFLLGKNKQTYTVYILEKTNILEGSFSFDASSAFIETYGDYLFIGKDNSISRISINRE